MRTKYYKKVIAAGIAIDTAGVVPADQVPQCQRHNFVVEFGVGSNAGVVKIEEAARPDYAGTWVVLATITYAAASAAQSVSVDAVKGALRARISTAIGGGGSVDVYAQGLG